MPLRITRPVKRLEHVAPKARADEACSELADLAQGALQSYTPNRWKKLLYKAVGVKAAIPGGYGVGGPIGGLLPNPSPAPKGVIAEFLMRHPEFVTRSRGRHRSFPQAWRHLPREARELLRDERLAGMYRSMAPAAPYWLIAEEGMERVGVPPRHYLRNSQLAVERGWAIAKGRLDSAL